MGDQLGCVSKTSLKSHVFSHLPNTHWEGARRSSFRSWFNNVGATVKKVLPLVENIQASLGVATCRNLACVDLLGKMLGQVTWAQATKGFICECQNHGFDFRSTSEGEPELEWYDQICTNKFVWLSYSGFVVVSGSDAREAPLREDCSSWSGRWSGPAPGSWESPCLVRGKVG